MAQQRMKMRILYLAGKVVFLLATLGLSGDTLLRDAEARRGEIFFGDNQGEQIRFTRQDQERILKEQLNKLVSIYDNQGNMLSRLQTMQEQITEMQKMNSVLLQRIAVLEEDRNNLLKKQAELEQARQEAEAVEARRLQSIYPQAGGNPGQIISRSDDGSITYRVR